MILWKKYGAVHIGTTDCGLRFEVRRYAGDRCYSLSMRTAGGGEAEHSTGYQSVRAAQVAALVTAAGRQRVLRVPQADTAPLKVDTTSIWWCG